MRLRRKKNREGRGREKEEYRGCEGEEWNQDSCGAPWRRRKGRFRCENGRVGEFDGKERERVKMEKAVAMEGDYVSGR